MNRIASSLSDRTVHSCDDTIDSGILKICEAKSEESNLNLLSYLSPKSILISLIICLLIFAVSAVTSQRIFKWKRKRSSVPQVLTKEQGEALSSANNAQVLPPIPISKKLLSTTHVSFEEEDVADEDEDKDGEGDDDEEEDEESEAEIQTNIRYEFLKKHSSELEDSDGNEDAKKSKPLRKGSSADLTKWLKY